MTEKLTAVNLQQIRTWFRWRQSSLTNATGQRQTVVNITQLLSASIKKKTRALTAVEKYSSLYYKTRVIGTVEAEFAALSAPPTRAQVLHTVKRVTKEKWDAEDESTRNTVLQSLADDKACKDVEIVPGDVRTPADYQR